MSATLFRVVNQGVLQRSILVDKIDRSQGNFTGYAQRAKQAVYVPLLNPNDKTVKGYIDMVPTDEVLLSMNEKGTLAQLQAKGYVSVTAFSSSLTTAPVISGAVHNSPANKMTITGTTMASLSPDRTYVTISSGTATQVLTDVQILAASGASFSTTSIVIPNSIITIGTPAAGWTVKIQANSKQSNVFTVT